VCFSLVLSFAQAKENTLKPIRIGLVFPNQVQQKN